MRNTVEHGITVEGLLPGKSVDLSFDSSAIAHLMTVLIDLYSNPALAVIREYSTNAYDSHVAAGFNEPIEVTLPGPLSREFKVKDYGVGLTRDEIESIYSKYGASTKRQTDEQVGMLGLGCKSGLTYADAFTMTAVKEGKKNVAIISRKDDGTGNILIQDERDTDEPNGVEVRMQVKDVNEFCKTANEFFRFWKPGTVLVNGKPPARIEGVEVDADTLLVKGLDYDYVVMGNVAYPVKEGNSLSHGVGLKDGSRVVVWVPIGAVHFTPNREALHYTTHTKATIATVQKQLRSSLITAAQRDINTAATPSDAVKLRSKWWEVLSARPEYTYNGTAIPASVAMPGFEYTWATYSNQTYVQRRSGFDLAELSQGLIVTGFDQPESFFTSYQKRKVKLWAMSKNHKGKVFIVNALLGSPWTDNFDTTDWDDVKVTKVPTNAVKYQGYFKNPGQLAGNYDVYVDNKWSVKQAQELVGKPLVYYSSGDLESANYRILEHFPGTWAVKLAKNRWDKFKRDFPQAQSVKEAVRSVQDRLLTADRDVLAVMATKRYVARMVDGLDPSKFHDPELARRMRVLQDPTIKKRAESYDSFSRFARALGCLIDVSQVTGIDFADYPMLQCGCDVPPEAVYEYANGVYLLRTQTNT